MKKLTILCAILLLWLLLLGLTGLGDDTPMLLVRYPYSGPITHPDALVLAENRGSGDPSHLIPRSRYRDGYVWAYVTGPGDYYPLDMDWGDFWDLRGTPLEHKAKTLSQRGVIQGVTNPTLERGVMTARFHPLGPVSGGEFALWLTRLFDLPPERAIKAPGEADAALTLSEMEAMAERAAAEFGPVPLLLPVESQSPATRGDALDLLYRLWEGSLPEPQNLLLFSPSGQSPPLAIKA